MFDKLGVPKYLAMSKTPVSECLSFSLDARNFMKKDHGTDVYLRILRNFKNTPFIEHLTTASDFTQHLSMVATISSFKQTCRKVFLKISQTSTTKHLCQSLFSNKGTGCNTYSSLSKHLEFWHKSVLDVDLKTVTD